MRRDACTRNFIYIALLAWLIVFIGLARVIARAVRAFLGKPGRAS